MSGPIRLLYVDDSPFDRELVRDVLEHQQDGFQLTEAASRAEFEARLAQGGYDLVLSDFNILGFEGLQVIDAVHAREPAMPVVIVTGTGSEEIAVAAIRSGAADYVIKTQQHIQRLPLTIHAVLDRLRLAAERQRADEQLRYQAEQISQIMRSVPDGMVLLDTDGRVLLANPAATVFLAVLNPAGAQDRLTTLGDKPLRDLLVPLPSAQWHELHAGERIFEATARPLVVDGPTSGWVLLLREVTQQRLAQRQFRTQERLAAVGQLAAGIAHDFNNLMGVIVLYGELLARSPALDSRDQARLATIVQQAEHATQLVRQILDFSRKSVLEQQPLALRPLVLDQITLLQRLLPENIETTARCGDDDYLVLADPTRIRQILLNLSINARDAMPDGGRLSLRLERLALHDPQACPLPNMPLGDWVQLTVADTGVGIPAEHLDRIFEPFFTTKAPGLGTGLGTGLGLAQVHGIVAQHGGYIRVTSKVGEGTAFDIYLPALAGPAAYTQPVAATTITAGNAELVLVVEDSEPLRLALTSLLESWNYRTLNAADGVAALALIAHSPEPVALVLSDAIMPKMGGVALLQALRQRNLKMPVILLTGHPLSEVELIPLLASGLHSWLLKPPDLARLAQALRDALAAPPA